MPTYKTLDNGGDAYKVTVNRGKVSVTNIQTGKKMSFTSSKTFVGQKGNVVVIKTAPKSNNYVYIGTKICRFKTEDPIKSLVSITGNSGVPYPEAYTAKGVYLLIEGVYLKMSKKAVNGDAYEMYYSHKRRKTKENAQWLKKHTKAFKMTNVDKGYSDKRKSGRKPRKGKGRKGKGRKGKRKSGRKSRKGKGRKGKGRKGKRKSARKPRKGKSRKGKGRRRK